MFVQDTLYRLRIGIRAVVSYMMSILCDPFREWESQMDANFHLTSTLDLTRTLAEFQLVAHHAQRLTQQTQRACNLITTGELQSTSNQFPIPLTTSDLCFRIATSQRTRAALSILLFEYQPVFKANHRHPRSTRLAWYPYKPSEIN